MDIFGIPRQEAKDLEETVVAVLDIKVSTTIFTLRFQRNKIYKVCELAEAIFKKEGIR